MDIAKNLLSLGAKINICDAKGVTAQDIINAMDDGPDKREIIYMIRNIERHIPLRIVNTP